MSEEKSELIDVQINGQWHSFPKGTRMIEACRQVAANVPHYCYHPKLSSPGNCRMCLVEMGMPPRPIPGQDPPAPDEDGHLPISWIPRPAISCANVIAPNMGIRTEGEMTEECRKGVMEFLLANHPLDCPICDQAGECSLQEFSVDHGNGDSRFREDKVKKPKNVKIGKRIRLDDERCIMCSRCIRFSEEILDDQVLGFVDRGSHTILTTYPGKSLDNNYSLNTVDICPVGALTSNDFRFKMRMWFMKETKTIDTNCATGCNIVVYSRNDEIYKITPRHNDEVNSNWIPDSHRLNFHWINDDNRLKFPKLEKKDKKKKVSWNKAIKKLLEVLYSCSSDEIALIVSARLTNEELYLIKILSDKLNICNIDSVPRLREKDNYLISEDSNPNTNGVKIIFNKKTIGSYVKNIEDEINKGKIKVLLSFQENVIKKYNINEDTLNKLDFFMNASSCKNLSHNYADLSLPINCWAEKTGSMINVTGRLQRLNKAINSPGESKDLIFVLSKIIHNLSENNSVFIEKSSVSIFNEMALKISEFNSITWENIGDNGINVIDTKIKIPLIEKEKERISKGIIVG